MTARRKPNGRWCLLLVALLVLSGCGTFEVGLERPTPTDATVATVAALIAENAQLATQVAQLAATPVAGNDLGKIAYVQQGDIWVRDLPNGRPQRLTTDGRNRAPRWSPSGQWLAFRKGDVQVWVVRTDDAATRPLNGGGGVDAFAWSPLQDRLAFVASSSNLRAVDADGANPLTLASRSALLGGAGEIGRIAWSPDGAQLAYEWRDTTESQSISYQGIWVVGADGRGQAEQFRGDATLAMWAADGQHLLLWRGSILSSAALLSEGAPLFALPVRQAQQVQLAGTMLAYPDFIAVDPSGSGRIATVTGGGRGTWTNKVLRVAAIGGAELVLSPPDQAATSPAWAPDGKRLAYAALPDRQLDPLAEGQPAQAELQWRRLFVIGVEPAEPPRQLTSDGAYRDERPLWSADGAFILFARIDGEGRGSIWFVGADGGEPRQVVDTLTPAPDQFSYYGHVDWESVFDWWRDPDQ